MKTLNEVEILSNIRLSHTQKFVLTKLISSQTPLTAYETISQGANTVAAREQLTKLGLMTFSDGSAAISDDGIELLKQEALVDDMGKLTELGSQYGYADTVEDIQSIANKQRQQSSIEAPEQKIGDTIGQPSPRPSVAEVESDQPMEAWSMISSMNAELIETSFLNFKKKL